MLIEYADKLNIEFLCSILHVSNKLHMDFASIVAEDASVGYIFLYKQ